MAGIGPATLGEEKSMSDTDMGRFLFAGNLDGNNNPSDEPYFEASVLAR